MLNLYLFSCFSSEMASFSQRRTVAAHKKTKLDIGIANIVNIKMNFMNKHNNDYICSIYMHAFVVKQHQ